MPYKGDDDDDRQKITRRRGACQLCREKKVRCKCRKHDQDLS